MNKNLTILFSSYGDYQDLLPITYYFFNKYWKDCPYDIFWGSNGKHIKDFNSIAPKWKYIYSSDEDLGWSKNLKTYLEDITTDYVLLLLDDFLLFKTPKEKLINDGLELMKKHQAVYLRLKANPKADKKITNIFGKINYYSAYRSSLQPAIWKKDILLKLCEYNFNPWEFEWKAGIVQETINKSFLGVFEDIIFTQHCIEKGMWIDFIYKKIKSENLNINSNRSLWNSKKNIINKESLKDNILELIHPKILFHLRKILKKGIFKEDFRGASHK